MNKSLHRPAFKMLIIFNALLQNMPHKSADFKLIAVQHYLNSSHNLLQTCNIFHCHIMTLYRWVNHYLQYGSFERLHRPTCSHKIRKVHVADALHYISSIKGKGFRSLFRRYGYKVFLVDEHKTSCRCANCGHQTKTFRWCHNPKYWKDNIMKRHGLLRCTNDCGLWNRDTNGSINIWKIAVSAIGRRERPEYLRRTRSSISGVSSTPTTPNLHEDPLTF